jgi:hypothetical protein
MSTFPQPPGTFIPYAVAVAPQRPTSVLVLGIVGIVLGAFGILGGLAGLLNYVVTLLYPAAMTGFRPSSWAVGLALGGLAFGAVEVWCSIGLLRGRAWARRAMVRWAAAYLAFIVLSTLVQCLVVLPEMLESLNATLAAAPAARGPTSAPASVSAAGTPTAAFAGMMSASMYASAVIGMFVATIYPVFVLVFMHRPNVRVAFDGAAARAGDATAAPPAPMPPPLPSAWKAEP